MEKTERAFDHEDWSEVMGWWTCACPEGGDGAGLCSNPQGRRLTRLGWTDLGQRPMAQVAAGQWKGGWGAVMLPLVMLGPTRARLTGREGKEGVHGIVVEHSSGAV